MLYFFSNDLSINKNEIISLVDNFNNKGELLYGGKRNKIKIFNIEDKSTNIKSFKIPHLLNKIVYKYFRKSKARRSFEFASTLIEKNIGTPQPIAYFEKYNWIGLTNSYYVSQQLDCDLTFRELVEIPDYPDHNLILKQFVQFSFRLHENGIEFLDHSPGNTLIKKTAEGNYEFFLVDLNRMNFHNQMDFDSRMKNLSRLTPKEEMIAIMSREYARLYNKKEKEVFDKMWRYTTLFQEKYFRKRRLKKQLFFWKKEY